MKILVYEHLTAGAMGAGGAELMDEGAAMVRAAMAGFSRFAQPFTIAAPGCIPLLDGIGEIIPSNADPMAVLSDALADALADALGNCQMALLIAPETGGALHQVTIMAEKRGVQNLGCSSGAALTCGEKIKFAAVMEKSGIPHPETWLAAPGMEHKAPNGARLISKPVDGAGCQDTRVLSPGAVAEEGMLIQRFVEGEAMSASVIGWKNGVTVLSVNRQFFDYEDGILSYIGGEVTAMEPGRKIIAMAEAVWKAIPGLNGYWGLDYIDTPTGPVIIEVNPRLTTSFIALEAATGLNPAELIYRAAKGERPPEPMWRRRVKFGKTGAIAI